VSGPSDGAAAGAVHTIELDGRRFAWRTLGAGRPLLLINGYAATSADWDPTLLDALGGSLQLICPDNRGMGESELGDASRLSIESMAVDLERLLDALGIERLAVAGWSMGSYIAQSLATRSPARVRALVLLAGAPPGPTAISAEPRVFRQLTDHSGTPREQATRLISLLFPPDVAPQIDREFGELVAEARAGLSATALDAQAQALQAWHAEQQPPPPAGSPPVLAICGSVDAVIPPQNAQALAARWPNTRVERIDGGGHAFMAQQPQLVARLIVDFLGA
jgi:pimeloyl-ACP methyl ester carboxylesterase